MPVTPTVRNWRLVAGTWIGRRAEDSTDEDARRYIKSKAFIAGQEMRKVQLGLPDAVGGGTVVSPGQPIPPEQPHLDPGGLGGVGTTQEGGAEVNNGNQQGETSGTSAKPSTVRHDKQSDEPGTGINLSGSFEKWGIAGSQTIDSAKIEFSGLSAQQIKQILLRIPSTFKATMAISYKEDGEQ